MCVKCICNAVLIILWCFFYTQVFLKSRLIGRFLIQFSDNIVDYFLLGHPVCTNWLFLWCLHPTLKKKNISPHRGIMYMSFNNAKPLMHTFYTRVMYVFHVEMLHIFMGHITPLVASPSFQNPALINFIEAGFREPAVRDEWANNMPHKNM